MTSLQRRPARRRLAASATALAVALGAAAPSAQAAVTAQQVWDDWKSNFDLYGENAVTVGSEDLQGGVLTVSDLAVNSTGEMGTAVSLTIPEITFTENGDGTVTVASTPEVPVSATFPGDPATGAKPTDVELVVRQENMTVTVSGDPGALSYALAADRYAVELVSLAQEGTAMPAQAVLAFNGVSGTTTATTAEMRNVAYDLAAASMDVLLDVPDPEQAGQTLKLSGQVQAIAVNATADMPLSMATGSETVLMDGLKAEGGYTAGPASYNFEFTDATGPTSGTLATQGGEASFRIGREALGYDASTRGVALDVTAAQMPFPVSAQIAEYGARLLIPAAKSDTPAPWALGINLADVAVNEEVWQLFDPQAMLDHGPATMIAQLSGTATPFFDLFDPAQEEAMAAAPAPGEINSVSLDDLNLSIGGAQVTGTGSFTLDNADTTTFPGIPKPTGVAEFQLNGVNGLIDDLVAMGLIPQEQVMGARMFLGLLAVPAGGDDQLSSRIEVTADGQLLANGQRLQ